MGVVITALTEESIYSAGQGLRGRARAGLIGVLTILLVVTSQQYV